MTQGIWVRRHALTAYFASSFAISWGGILAVLGVFHRDSAALGQQATALIFIVMLLGPFGSGLALTAWTEGKSGLRRLAASLGHVRAEVRWYVIALLTVPFLLLGILWALSVLVDPSFRPGFKWPLLAVGIAAGALEEIGWTGFATRRLLKRQRVPAAGLTIGVLWALWHLLVGLLYDSQVPSMPWLLQFAVFWLAPLVAYRLLITSVYARTRSLPVAVAMHASYTGWLMVLYPDTSSEQALLWQAAFAVGLWIAAAVAIRASISAPPKIVSPALDIAPAPIGGPSP